MKIIYDEGTFLLPESNHINLLVAGTYKKKLIECLDSYLVNKKKTKCIIYDDEGDVLDNKNVSFIYVSKNIDYGNNYSLKTKSFFNLELSKFIMQNPERFLSVERLRDTVRDLTSDNGMYSFIRILNQGIEHTISIDVENIEIESLIQMLSIDIEKLNAEEKLLMICNLALYLHRNEFAILFLDIDINECVSKWLKQLDLSYKYILIDNDSFIEQFDLDYNMILLSNNDFLISEETDNKEIERVSYLFHPLVLKYLTYQNDIFLKIYQKYAYEKATFFLNTVS